MNQNSQKPLVIEERKIGMEAGFGVLLRSDYSAVYRDYGVSKGMIEGLIKAFEARHEIQFRYIGRNHEAHRRTN